MKLFLFGFNIKLKTKASLASIDFPAIAFTHIWNYHFIVRLMRFFTNNNRRTNIQICIRYRQKYYLQRVSSHKRAKRRKRNKHILLLLYHFIVSITGVFGKSIFFSFLPLFIFRQFLFRKKRFAIFTSVRKA